MRMFMCLLSMDGDAGASPFVAESALDADSFESILDMNESRGKRILRSFMQVLMPSNSAFTVLVLD